VWTEGEAPAQHVLIGESVERSQHVCKHLRIESRVDLCCALQQQFLAEALREFMDVGEVASLRTVEQCDHLAPRQFRRVVRRSDQAHRRLPTRW
jgi:hypothetical protein